MIHFQRICVEVTPAPHAGCSSTCLTTSGVLIDSIRHGYCSPYKTLDPVHWVKQSVRGTDAAKIKGVRSKRKEVHLAEAVSIVLLLLINEMRVEGKPGKGTARASL